MIQHKNFMDFWTLILNTRVLKKAFPLLEIGSYLHLALQNQTENCHQMYPDLRDKNKQNSFIFLWNIEPNTFTNLWNWIMKRQLMDSLQRWLSKEYDVKLSSPCWAILKAGSGDDRPCSSRSWKAVSCSRLSFFSSLLHCCMRLFLTALLGWSSSQSLRAASNIFIWSDNSASTKLIFDSCKS